MFCCRALRSTSAPHLSSVADCAKAQSAYTICAGNALQLAPAPTTCPSKPCVPASLVREAVHLRLMNLWCKLRYCCAPTDLTYPAVQLPLLISAMTMITDQMLCCTLLERQMQLLSISEFRVTFHPHLLCGRLDDICFNTLEAATANHIQALLATCTCGVPT